MLDGNDFEVMQRRLMTAAIALALFAGGLLLGAVCGLLWLAFRG